MRPVHGFFLLGAGVVSLCAQGCFGPNYNPYAYPPAGYPAYGNGGFQTLTPGPQYVPGGTYDSGAGTPGAAPTYSQPSGPTPTYGNGADRPVPSPSDPNSPYFPQPGEQYRSPTNGVHIPQENSGSEVSQLNFETEGDAQPHAVTQTAAWQQEPAAAHTSGPYGHDPQKYAWIQGVVSYDETDRSWNIVYNLEPSNDDPYAGHFTLAANPLLQTLKEGEHVRLEGAVDPARQDQFGKPTYAAERVIRTQS
jgi:hypothetical protein